MKIIAETTLSQLIPRVSNVHARQEVAPEVGRENKLVPEQQEKLRAKIEELKRENKQLREQHAKEMATNEEQNKAEIVIASLQAQMQRQLSDHKSESRQTEEDLFKKAENHAAELKDLIEKHQQQLEEKEVEQKKLVQELNEYFQNEIKAAHHQWQQIIAHTWEVDRSDIKISDVTIGTGRVGTIMKGYFRGIQVAVKKLNPDIVSEQNIKLVRWEINLLAQIRHPNLVQFLGAVISSSGSSLIVTELLEMSLKAGYQQSKISMDSKAPIIVDVASALTYLHTNRVPVVHQDVSSSRVILEAIGGVRKWKAKLSVFGSTNIIPSVKMSYAGASVYAAPEVITGDSRHQTDKVDVYSFGVLICEVVLCRSPPDKREEFPVMLGEVHAKNHDLFQLALDCTKQSQRDRPSMMEVTRTLLAYTN